MIITLTEAINVSCTCSLCVLKPELGANITFPHVDKLDVVCTAVLLAYVAYTYDSRLPSFGGLKILCVVLSSRNHGRY